MVSLSSPDDEALFASVLSGFVTLILSQSLFNLFAVVAALVVVVVGGDGTDVIVAVAELATLASSVAVTTVALPAATLFIVELVTEVIRLATWGDGVVGVAAAMLALIEEIFIRSS